ncbi:MAG: aromatic ring-hydroxylating oxygenase subunit alpha [Marinibacterium sp.]
MTDFSDLLTRLAALPADRPMGMPGAFYADHGQFERECATLLRRGWHCLGRADEVPEPGDFFTVDLLGEPVVVIRGQDGRIRALANLCRHRNMPLAEGRGSVRRLVCPYHAWAYDLDGTLLRAPRMENAGFDPATCRLPEFPARIWNGFVQVSLDPAASPPDLGALDSLLDAYAPDTFRLVHVAEEDWHTNWKCLVENFMEGYHLSVVHPQTLHGYTPSGLARKLVSGDGFTSYGANYPDGAAPRGTGAPGLSPEERRRSTLFAVFPTHVASQAASLLVSLSIFPRAVDRITVKWTLSVRCDDLDDETIRARIALWENVNREDREKLERMQTALGSVHAHAGPLAGEDYEGTVRDFLIWLARQDGHGACAAE